MNGTITVKAPSLEARCNPSGRVVLTFVLASMHITFPGDRHESETAHACIAPPPRLAEANLHRQVAALLAKSPGLDELDIAEELNIDLETACTVVDDLLRQGVIERGGRD